MRRPLPPQMRVPLGGLGRGPVAADDLMLRDWSTRLIAPPVAALARFLVSSPTNQPGTAHLARAS